MAGERSSKGMGTGGGVTSSIYGLAFIGAAVYYFQHATSLWGYVLGFFKAVLWPAFLIYNLLDFLKM